MEVDTDGGTGETRKQKDPSPLVSNLFDSGWILGGFSVELVPSCPHVMNKVILRWFSDACHLMVWYTSGDV